MAGFDFFFRNADNLAPYVDACIRAAKSRSRQLGCRWRVQQLEDDVVRCVVDGQSRRLDLLGRALEQDLPTVCEGVRGELAPRQARQIGTGFAELYLKGRDVDHADDEVQVLRKRHESSLYYPLYDFVNAGRGTPALRARLRVTEDIVTDFGLGRYPDEVLLEELHTALEQTLRLLLLGTVQERAHWPALVSTAKAQGFLGWSGVDWTNAVGHPHTDRALLRDLTRRRNVSKHDHFDHADTWLTEHWDCVGYMLERLVRLLPVST